MHGCPTFNRLARLSLPFKHHLADPALAARLLGVDADVLLKGGPSSPWIPRDGTMLGALFESLVTLSVRVYAQRIEARTYHLRTRGGEHEVDLIVERGQSVVAIEVKLGVAPDDADVRHLLWLKDSSATNSPTWSSSPPAARHIDAATASRSSPPPCSAPERRAQ